MFPRNPWLHLRFSFRGDANRAIQAPQELDEDEMDENEDTTEPSVPHIPQQFRNGGR